MTRSFTANPSTCPECGYSVVNGACSSSDCDWGRHREEGDVADE